VWQQPGLQLPVLVEGQQRLSAGLRGRESLRDAQQRLSCKLLNGGITSQGAGPASKAGGSRKAVSFEYSFLRVDTYATETRFLTREVGDEGTALNMISLAVCIGDMPVVTRTLTGETIGVRYDTTSASLTVGFGWAAGGKDM